MKQTELVALNKQLKSQGKRYCNKCSTIKPLKDFDIAGHQSACRKCVLEYRNDRYNTNDAYRAGYQSSNNKHYNNKIKTDDTKMAKRRSYGRKYCAHATSSSKMKLKRINDRMNLRCAGTLSKQDMEIIKTLFVTCAYCGGPLGKYHLDHIVSIKDKGTTALGNISRVCSSCNLSKGAKDFDTWYLEQTFFDASRYLIIKQYQSLYHK